MDHADSRLGKSNESICNSFRISFETGLFLRNVIYIVLLTQRQKMLLPVLKDLELPRILLEVLEKILSI